MEFDYVTKVNVERCRAWHGSSWPIIDNWSLADWSNAMLGEAGEAANIVKKIRRLETHHTSRLQEELPVLTVKLGDELADTFLYLDLLAFRAGIYLPQSLQNKFNEISLREKLPHRLWV